MKNSIKVISGNTLKIIAAVSMLIDHIGMILFPQIMIFRILGRLAFPLFAFMIAEGCKYTKNKLKYLLTIFSLGIVCQIFVLLVTRQLLMNVLITFSLSICVCYALENAKKVAFSDTSRTKIVLSVLIPIALVGAIFFLNSISRLEYGFIGCMLPPLASLPSAPPTAPPSLKRLDTLLARTLVMGLGLLLFCITADTYIQYFSLAALPLLLFYSEKRGRLRLKYFFYIFYPAHLLILYGILILTL